MSHGAERVADGTLAQRLQLGRVASHRPERHARSASSWTRIRRAAHGGQVRADEPGRIGSEQGWTRSSARVRRARQAVWTGRARHRRRRRRVPRVERRLEKRKSETKRRTSDAPRPCRAGRSEKVPNDGIETNRGFAAGDQVCHETSQLQSTETNSSNSSSLRWRSATKCWRTPFRTFPKTKRGRSRLTSIPSPPACGATASREVPFERPPLR